MWRNGGLRRPSSPADRRIPTFPASKQIELDGNLVPCRDPCLAPDLGLHRQQISTAIQREQRRAPNDLLNSGFNLDGSEAARTAEGMRLDLDRLLFWYGDEIPAARCVRTLPDPQQRRDGDHAQ